MLSNVCSNVIKISSTQIQALNSRRSLHKSHYEVLGLPKNCSTKDIKNAFITLSKVHHPDKNKNVDSKEQFVKLSEAYQVLSKPGARRLYDLELNRSEYSHRGDAHRPTRRKTRQYGYGYDDPSFWANRSRYEYQEQQGYYGVPGVQRVPNAFIAIMCLFFSAAGALLQFYAVRDYDVVKVKNTLFHDRHSVTLKRELIHARSLEYEKTLTDLQEEAAKMDKEAQIKMMEEKLLANEMREVMHARSLEFQKTLADIQADVSKMDKETQIEVTGERILANEVR